MSDEEHDLDLATPAEIEARSKKNGNEWLFCFHDARAMINNASVAGIAVLGVEIFRDDQGGLETVHYNSYEFECVDWNDFVEENNAAAIDYMNANVYGKDYVYILSSVSKREFEALKAKS